MRHPHLGVAVLAGVQLEHEVGQRALEAGQRAPQHDEARLGHPGGALEIHQAERLADLLVRLGREGELSRPTPAAHFDVLVLGLARRHRRVGHVRDLEEEALHLAVHALELGLERLDPLAHLAHARLLVGRVLAAALGLADRLGGLVAQRLELLALTHEPSALGVQGEQRPDQLGASAVHEGALDRLGILADQSHVQHVRSSLSVKQKRPPGGGLVVPVRGDAMMRARSSAPARPAARARRPAPPRRVRRCPRGRRRPGR